MDKGPWLYYKLTNEPKDLGELITLYKCFRFPFFLGFNLFFIQTFLFLSERFFPIKPLPTINKSVENSS